MWNFKEFMYLKYLGRFDGMKHGIAPSIPSKSISNYNKNKKIVENLGIEYGDWKAVRKLRREGKLWV